MRKYLFDSNAIFLLFKKGKIEPLLDNYTISLAVFELGNIIWKESNIYKSIDMETAHELIGTFNDILSLMTVINVDRLDFDVLDFAHKHHLTYYDASYLYVSLKYELTLVTEDAKLRKVASKVIEAIGVDDL